MTNEDRLPAYQQFVDDFGHGFITDTYSNVRDADGFEDTFDHSLAELRKESNDPDNWNSWQRGVTAGSVTAQYLELLWAMHREDFWSWRFENA